MPTRSLLAILATLLLITIGNVVFAQSEPVSAAAEDPRLLPYMEPGQRGDIGGMPHSKPDSYRNLSYCWATHWAV